MKRTREDQPLLQGLALIAALSSAFLGLGCASSIHAHQPPSLAELSGVNRSIQGDEAAVTLVEDEKPELVPAPAAPGPDPAAALPPRRRVTTTLVARDIQVGRDETQWIERKPGPGEDWQSRKVPTADLLQIRVRRPGLGALEGFLLGLPLGMIGGTTLGYFVGSSSCQGSNECGAYTAVSTLVGFVAGTLLGMIGGTALGAYAGDTSTVEFGPPIP